MKIAKTGHLRRSGEGVFDKRRFAGADSGWFAYCLVGL
jgi:hypothetical protein